MANVPPNPAHAKIAAVQGRTDAGIGAGPQQPQRISKATRALMAKHAAERVDLETSQWNERIDMQERHAAEIAATRAKEADPAAAAPQPAPKSR